MPLVAEPEAVQDASSEGAPGDTRTNEEAMAEEPQASNEALAEEPQASDEALAEEREGSGSSGVLEYAHVRSLHGRDWATLPEQQRPDRQRQERLRQVQSGRAFGGW